MKKYLFVLCCCIAFVGYGQEVIVKKNAARKFYLGLFGGPNYSDIYRKGTDINKVLNQCNIKYLAGLNVEYFLVKNISINTGVFYNSTGEFGSLSYNDVYSFNTINVPFNLKVHFGNKTKFYVNSGLNIGFFIPNESFSEDDYKSNEVDFIFGLGVSQQLNDKLNLNLELRESLGLSNIQQPIYANGTIYNWNVRTQAVSLLVGLSYAIK